MTINKFKNVIFPSHHAPLNFMYLDNWSCVTVEGIDSTKYLQGQLTINTVLLPSNKHIICAHCNINGKIWSIMRLLKYKNGYLYIQRDDVSGIQIQELKKYSIFSNVIIKKENNLLLLGMFGLGVKQFLLDYFIHIPNKRDNIVHNKNITLLWFQDPIERFLLILPKYDPFIAYIENSNLFMSTNDQWMALDIEAGYPIISRIMMNKVMPLSVNLEYLGGLDFKKGCYYGQEMIAKIKFKSLNKYSLYWIQCDYFNAQLPNIGDAIEVNKKNNWFVVGYILAFVIVNNHILSVQSVLDSKLNKNDILRLHGIQKNYFYIKKHVIIN